MKYRIVLKYSYKEVYFEFEDLQDASEFIKTIQKHIVPDEDGHIWHVGRIDVLYDEDEGKEE